MKNFPHQINEISKLVAALGVYKELLEKGADPADDGIFGYALATALVYRFRNQSDVSPAALADRIEREKQKQAQNQGARTAARDIRRLFELSHFIDPHGITQMGQNILDAGSDTKNPIVQHLWRNAMQDIVISSSTGQKSHPYQVLLNIVKARPQISGDKLALALEAEDDSSQELQRVLRIADSQNWIDLINCSPSQRRNAIKILPSIARQIGDITGDRQIRSKKPIIKPDLNRLTSEESEELLFNADAIFRLVIPKSFSYHGKPKTKQSLIGIGKRKFYPRDPAVKVNALVHANHQCEIDNSHKTFTRKSTNMPYMEPHHLVPLAFSDSFDVSLDVEENVVSLCSTCHNCIHYGSDAAKLIEKLYKQRKDLLKQVGIEVTLDELLDMY